MRFDDFANALSIKGKVLSIMRKRNEEPLNPSRERCGLKALNNVFKGETLRLSIDSVACAGGKYGFGFTDKLMQIPGGYGHFVSYGSDEKGAPAGMRLKLSPELALQGVSAQAKNVMQGFDIIEVKPYEATDKPDLVTVLAAPDQLSALNLLFNFRQARDDGVFFPPGSGCASIFRLPFAELEKESPRAVIGNADISTRPNFDPVTLFFTVSGEVFRQMLADADESFLITAAWKKIASRL